MSAVFAPTTNGWRIRLDFVKEARVVGSADNWGVRVIVGVPNDHSTQARDIGPFTDRAAAVAFLDKHFPTVPLEEA